MRVLYIHTDIVSDADVRDTLLEMVGEISEYENPEKNQEDFVRVLEERKIDMVLSLIYMPVVSVLCEAMHIKYVAWICKAYDPNIYSCTMVNSCNYIFLADGRLYDKFMTEGFQNVYYLPLGVNSKRIQKKLSERNTQEDESVDLIMAESIFDRSELPANRLLTESYLRDSTRGYIEGCIACQYQIRGIPAMTQNFPAYIWEDLYTNLPMSISSDSVESKENAYNGHVFNELVTQADRDIHFGALAGNDHFKNSELYTESQTYKASHTKIYRVRNFYKEFPVLAARGKIHLMITDRNWGSGISQTAWDIMAAGGFVVSDYLEDYQRIFQTIPAIYFDERSMLSKAIYYLHHEEERRDLAKTIQKEIEENHTYVQRLQNILTTVQAMN